MRARSIDRSTVREIAIVYINVRWSLFFVSSFIYHTQIVICLNQAWSGGMAMDKSVDPTCICMRFFMPFLIIISIYQSEKEVPSNKQDCMCLYSTIIRIANCV